MWYAFFFFFSSRRRHTRFDCDWSSDVCSSDLPLGVGELHDLVFDRWAVPRASRGDGAAVQRRLLEVPADDVLHFLAAPRDPTRHLTGPLHSLIKREPVRGRVAVLTLDLGPIDRAAVHPRRRTGLEARDRKSKRFNVLRYIDGGLVARPPRRNLRVRPEVNAATQEGPRRDHDRARREHSAVGCRDARRLRSLDYEAAHRALCQLEVREALKQRTNRAPVQRAIALGARRPHRWSLRAVEHAKLDRRAVGGAAHDTAERVELAHYGALRDAADGGIAAQLADGVEVRREEECPCPQSSCHD